MQFSEPKNKTHCPACGKETVKRDIRDKGPQFCSRVCGGLSRFATRYQGSNAGPADKPVNIMEKTKFKS